MSHEVENMFYVNQTPWHGLGQRLIEVPTIQEGIAAAGLDWTVSLKPLVTKETGMDVPAMATFRNDNEKVLGVVGPNYKPLQNIEAFNFFQPVLEQGLATLETAGSLRDGKRVWILAKLKGDPINIAKGDDILKYALLSNSHDGTMAVRVGFTPIRVVCANTLSMSHNNAQSQLIRVRHSGNVVENLELIRETMDMANAKFEAQAEQYRFLASRQINKSDLKKYIEVVFGMAPETERKRSSAVMENVLQMFDKGRGNDIDSIKGTYWAAYNAAIEYMQYESGKDRDARLDKNWFGQNVSKNNLALQTAITMATLAA